MTISIGVLKGYMWSTAYNYEYLLGNYEEEKLIEQFLFWCNSNSIFYDLGANIGYHSFLANTKITNGKIYAFEPLPKNCEVFKNHLALNKKRIKNNNIEIYEFAIADSSKVVHFSNNDDHIDGNTYIKNSFIYQQAKNEVPVQAYSIDDLITKGFEPPTIIKIDVEGAELDVLKGAKTTIKKYKPHILLATHNCHLPNVKEGCLQFLKDINYTYLLVNKHNKVREGLDDFIAVHQTKVNQIIYTN